LFYLKDKFNRPRPYQLADVLELELYPIIRTDANSAAYPSGHSLDFLVTLYHFGKMKPDAAEEIDEFYHEIKRVRELSGVHYPSDRKISEYLFKQLVKHNLIK
jgi:acid phosphatase (class A)